MELKIKIPERIYDEITKEGQISLSDLHELFDAIRNGIAADEPLNAKKDEASKTNNKTIPVEFGNKFHTCGDWDEKRNCCVRDLNDSFECP